MRSDSYRKTVTAGVLKAVNSVYLVKILAGEYYNIFRKRHLYRNVRISESEEAEIQDMWAKHYGRRISTRWHRLYQSYSGRFNVKYFPEMLFTTKLERKLNNREIGRMISDKSFLAMYYRDIEGVRLPDTYLINNSGVFYTSDRKIISKEKAHAALENIGAAVFKPTLDSSSGDSVALYDLRHGADRRTGRTLAEVLDSYGGDFIVQEKIIPSGSLKALYDGSVNTLRVITYLVGDRVFHAPITLSMGRGGSHVDNIQAGGISVAVSDDGELGSEGLTFFGEAHRFHPDTGTLFANHTLPNIGKLIRVACEMHEKTPHMRMVSWDFTLDENDDIVLLEFNIFGQSVWFPQMVSGRAVFGEHTEQMIRMMRQG
ncbi:sugar-transfer associated ATP-grasp domain-containing protein [Salinicoccus carnicancri]|uniref:sugar-transfer associated ATP-grasp domain-containing protein n=1 Tax=Salinicoccus carnicancri TaxID=558170 RepID=UPI0002F4C489|nr:sugar-transfer associated ATP-grasp domain-containing protein [Salinicoccus carnicancri]